MISLSVAEAFVGFGYRASSDASSERIQSVEDIVGKTIRLSLLTLGEIYVTVTGVFDAEDDFSRYDSLRVPELPGDAEATALAEEFSEAYEYSFSSVCFTGEGFYERYDHFDRSRREYQNLMQQVENYGGTTSYTEDSASFIRYSRLMAPLAGNAVERAQALFAYYGKEEKSAIFRTISLTNILPRSIRAKSFTRSSSPSSVRRRACLRCSRAASFQFHLGEHQRQEEGHRHPPGGGRARHRRV